MGSGSSVSSLPALLSQEACSGSALAASYRALMARETARREYRGRFAANASQSKHNRDKNRYGDIVAYDATRVELPGDRYINANWIDEPSSLLQGHRSKRRWLATQGPLPETLYDFWSVFLSLPSREAPRKIVMLTGVRARLTVGLSGAQLVQLVESSRVKCERYFPAKPDEKPLRLIDDHSPPIEVRLLSVEAAHRAFRKNRISVGYAGQQPVEVEHFECVAWRDHGVPDSPADLLHLIKAVDSKADQPPTLVHCSAGVGRTGTYIATACLLDALPSLTAAHQQGSLKLNKPEIEQLGLPPMRREDLNDPVALIIDHLRAQRNLMVQTAEQQGFIYECLQAARKEAGRS